MPLKWILGIAAVPIGLLALAYAVGTALPESHVTTAETAIPRRLAEVARIIRDVEGQPRWRKDVEEIVVLEREDAAIRYIERSHGESITYQLTEEKSGTRFRIAILSDDLPFGGYWIIKLAASERSTIVAIEEHGTVTNPVFRFLSRFVLGQDATIKKYLQNLKNAGD